MQIPVRLQQTKRSWMIVLLSCLLAGCASNDSCVDLGTPEESLRSVYVIKRAWHTGIAVAASDWPNRDWTVLADFPDSKFIEFGWGDGRFYQAEQETLWLGIRAALFSTDSVVHVIGFQQPTPQALIADEVIEVRVSPDGLNQLTGSIEREFAASQPVAIGGALDATPKPNKFYVAKRRFFFPRMCNWWTAKRLQDGGCPISAWSVIFAERVMREAGGFASPP